MLAEAGPPVDAVDGAALMATCALMAQRMKLSGTPEERASLLALRDMLDGFGYRTSLLEHDAYVSLPGAARVVVDGVPLPAITHSFSLASGPEGLRAPLVHVGDGEGLAGSDVRGCIVLADGIATPVMADRVRRAGAVGQLQVSPHEHLHEMCISPVWGSPGASTRAQLPGAVTCSISQADGAVLRARVLAGERPDVVLHAAVDTGWRKTPILVAELDGPEADAPFVLFSGHHDTWYFGVMDNGSANATMVECARVLAQHRTELRRGLRLCFWSGHSHGRYSGSAWYADTHWDELERRCAVHVNIDSTGGTGASLLEDAAAAPELCGVAAAAIAAETGQTQRGLRNGRNSDMSFWGVGIPSMLGSVSFQPPGPVPMPFALGWWWHTPEDLLDKVDEGLLVRDTRVFLRVLWQLLTAPLLPLDFSAHAQALLAVLAEIGGPLPLDGLTALARDLRDKAAALTAGGLPPERVNRALMQLSRALVPMDCTEGDRFVHDPALPLSPWPVLDPVRALAAAPGDRFLMVDAVRARNRMQHALRQAVRALDAALDEKERA